MSPSNKAKKSKRQKSPKSPTAIRQLLFIQEYLKDFNGKQAAIRAGYSPKTAEVTASKLLRAGKVADAIEKAKQERVDVVKKDSNYVLQKLYNELEADLGEIFDEDNNLLPVKEWPPEFRKGLVMGIDVVTERGEDGNVSYTSKVKLADRNVRTALYGKHVDVKAFEKVTRQEVGDSVVEAMEKARERAKSLRR